MFQRKNKVEQGKFSTIDVDSFCPVGIGGTKDVDVKRTKLFIGGLQPEITSQKLFDLFKNFGVIREAVVIPDRFRVRSRCYGFVTFKDQESVSTLFESLPFLHKGKKFTIVLASSNARPRRANFQVKHGSSGHKYLPKTVRGSDYSKIYNQSDLYRTANIQSITPAKLCSQNHKIPDTGTGKANSPNNWMNKDVSKDIQILMSCMRDVQSGTEKSPTNATMQMQQFQSPPFPIFPTVLNPRYRSDTPDSLHSLLAPFTPSIGEVTPTPPVQDLLPEVQTKFRFWNIQPQSEASIKGDQGQLKKTEMESGLASTQKSDLNFESNLMLQEFQKGGCQQSYNLWEAANLPGNFGVNVQKNRTNVGTIGSPFGFSSSSGLDSNLTNFTKNPDSNETKNSFNASIQ